MAEKAKAAAAAAAKRCFVICPIGDEGTPIRDRSDQVLEFIIQPAAQECGYTDVIRADHMTQPGIITNQVIELIRDADMVVADLTGHNANVMYELAIRHALRRPLVQMIHAGEKLPFDIAMSRTIPFNWQDLRSANKARLDLVSHLRAAEANPDRVDNPITTAIELSGLQQSGDKTEVLLGRLIEQVQELGQQITTVGIRVTDVERRALLRNTLFRTSTTQALAEQAAKLQGIVLTTPGRRPRLEHYESEIGDESGGSAAVVPIDPSTMTPSA